MKEIKSRTTWYVCPETGQEPEPEPEQEQQQERREQDAETGQYLAPRPAETHRLARDRFPLQENFTAARCSA